MEMSSTRRGARCAVAAATAWAALMAAPASAQSDIPLQPFPVNHELRIDSGADARFLLDGPAGKYGFIEARDGHLYRPDGKRFRSEEHTSELQSLMRISYAVFCLNKKNTNTQRITLVT